MTKTIRFRRSISVQASNFDDWLNSHFSMPYVDWLPLEVKIYKWLSAGFRLRLPTKRAVDLKPQSRVKSKSRKASSH